MTTQQPQAYDAARLPESPLPSFFRRHIRAYGTPMEVLRVTAEVAR